MEINDAPSEATRSLEDLLRLLLEELKANFYDENIGYKHTGMCSAIGTLLYTVKCSYDEFDKLNAFIRKESKKRTEFWDCFGRETPFTDQFWFKVSDLKSRIEFIEEYLKMNYEKI